MSRHLLKAAICCLVFLIPGVVLAQNATVTGSVTDQDGEPLIGAQILIPSLTLGAATDINGTYTFDVPANRVGQNVTLTVRYIGFRTEERPITLAAGTQVHDFVLRPDLFDLDEVVVTGVVSGTPQKKLAFTVNKVDTEKLQEVPAVNAGSALQGKVAGVRVVSGSGQPGAAPSFRLRGSTSIRGGQDPLIIVDGVILEGSLADINSEDIESIEVVKDAAAASLYGSRAANGVVQIFTKRGKGLAQGNTQVTVRNEFGVSSLAKTLDLADHHHYLVNANGEFVDADGNLIPTDGEPVSDPDQIADNPFAINNDHIDDFFDPGNFYTNHISVAQNTGKTNFLVSFSNSQQDGIIFGSKGYGRQNFRANIDHTLAPGLEMSLSTLYGQSETDDVENTGDNPFYGLLFMAPNVDLSSPNEEDGTPYNWDAGWIYNQSLEQNPLYGLEFNERTRNRLRQLANFRISYRPLQWLGFEGSVSLDREQDRVDDLTPRGYLSDNPAQFKGILYKYSDDNRSINTALTTFVDQTIGDLTMKFKASYLYEDEHFENFQVTGREFAVAGTPDLGATVNDDAEASLNSYIADVRAENVFGIIDLDYRDRYIASFLFRRDGSSLFGEDARWANYYRISGAYRISEDFQLPGIDELKLRASYGTSGLRPPFAAQYETFAIVSGNAVKSTIGNRNLKPAYSEALEVGMNVDFLQRFSLEVAYATNNTTDQILPVPLASHLGGYGFQWKNAGTLEAKTIEATLNTLVAQTRNFEWTFDLTFDRTTQRITELNVPPFRASAFYIAPDTEFGVVYGEAFARDITDLDAMLAAGVLGEGVTAADFLVNEDGYVVRADEYGTVDEKPIKLLDAETGNPALVEIGNANPNFNMGFASTIRYRNFSLFTLLDWKNGGDVYNNTRQWILRELRGGEVDQTGKPDAEKKPVNYYATLYNVNATTSHFVEDGSYLKVREIALGYTLNRNQLAGFGLGVPLERVKVSLAGRNLFTFTDYTGYDPEVNNSSGAITGDSANFFFDGFGYPNFRTFTGTLEIVF